MKTKMAVEFCDNPGCGYSEVVGADKEGAMGYHFGKGWYVLAGGGPIPAFYAHQESCIVPALKHVMEH